ncbi:mlp-like protein 34 [Nicotiana attenuata]|uniref:Mlp-like protein 34 n=1 Tax=Nicotiana attenuata TaxID=49451 RepID=A0A314LEJ4_NICAT|nr:mlp-like protein 34 [Nicotiana attenuata]
MGLKGKLISQIEIKGCSVVNWNYTIEGQEKVVVEAIDEEKRLVTFSAFEGHLIEQYKAFKATVHIENEGENNLVLWTIEYEKQNDEVSEPFSYLEFATNLTKDVDAHHVNQ